jgi:DNA polymerase III subunit gamma/tau
MRFAGPREFGLNIKDPTLKSAIEALLGRPVKVTFTAGEAAAGAAPATPPPAAASNSDDAITREALANPEVQRFQEMFPGSQVRNVRNLKDV